MEEIAGAAHKYINHDMIRDHTSLPDFPELRTKLLRAFLAAAEASGPNRAAGDIVSIAVSLVQMGLDTHERVERTAKTITRQMTVLAGDYFSSRFYQLLSQAGDVQSIGVLSESICEVNRMKMVLYGKAKKLLLTAEDYVRATVDIKTHLYLSFTFWMEEMRRKAWPALVRAVAECELIADDLSRLQSGNIRDGWAQWYVLEHGTSSERDALLSGSAKKAEVDAMLQRYRIAPQLTEMLETKLAELKGIVQGIGPERFSDEIWRLVQPLFQLSKHPVLNALRENAR
ncbi:heptaprenyl diphosphate synthase component 1 [Paenibacillus thermotolerans]|uniref:heptaprenyl diphosphate synthase component 1 n=1 Tax=Paenibacillus thermotolerans TaxID=3027807 RepID=UPI00236893C4|nr:MULTISPECIES: heptaprenyl diphosphate synthase component 1 [unclassified Paenibacillus]